MKPTAFILLLLMCTCASAQELPAKSLRNGTWQLGIWGGGGTGLGKASDFQFINSGFRIGRVLTGEVGHSRLRGNFEWAADLIPLYLVRQNDFVLNSSGTAYVRQRRTVYGGSMNPVVLKWNFTGNRKVAPFVEADGGVLFTTSEVPAGDTSRVNFTPGAAFGMHIFTRARRAITFSAHVIHISNGSLADRNPGINSTLQFRMEYTWFK